ncbi:MAG: AMP-binding protein, partial [Desulfobacterales bacterium]|nr:AMP-binding protein [Desulfobacterales bacterium]
MLVGDIVCNNARLFPEKIGIVDAQSRLRFTWKEINSRVNRLVNALTALGVGKGDRVGIISENSYQCAEFHFTLAKMGAIGCPLNYRLHAKQLDFIINDAAPRILLVQEQYAELIDSISPNLNTVEQYVGLDGEGCYPLDYESLLKEHPDTEPSVEIHENDAIIITYTSGTTGLPKGILSTHKNRIAYALESCLFADRYDHDDVVLVSAPFCAGVSGQIQLVAPALVGATAVMFVLRGDTWGEVIEREKVTALITTKSRMMP